MMQANERTSDTWAVLGVVALSYLVIIYGVLVIGFA